MNEATPNIKSSVAASGQGEIDLLQVWRIVMRQKWNILSLCFVISVFVAFIAFSIKPVYEATTTVLIESQQANVVAIEDVYGGYSASQEYFRTQFEILRSRELAVKVVERLNLVKHRLFDPSQQEEKFNLIQWIQSFYVIDDDPLPLSEDLVFDGVVDSFRSGLTISPVSGTQLVKINYESTDAKLAALVSNTLADVYIESHLEAKLIVTRKATDWLGTRIGDLRDKLKASEARLQNYREQEQLVDVDGVRTLDAGELKELTQNLADSRQQRAQLETISKQIQALGESPTVDRLLGLSSILQHSLVQNLKQAQAQKELKVAELSKRYGPAHPNMISANSEADSAEVELRLQVSRVAAGIKADYENAVVTERALQGQVNVLKDRLQTVNRKEFRLKELEREVETNRHLYDLFLSRSKETDETSGLQSAHARVVDSAVTPRSPVKPRKALMIIFAFILSAASGMFLAVLRALTNNTIQTIDDIEEKLQVSLLGFVPLVKTNKSESAFEGFLSDSQSNFAESIRTIRTGLMLSGLDQNHKITVITSSVPSEGKSTVALNLAEAIGQMEKVLLIDADMRRPMLAKTLGLPRSTPGLSNLISGKSSWKECVHPLPGKSQVDVITAGVVIGNPLELLSSDRFGNMIQKLTEHYNRIIIDSAPCHAVSDALVLSTYADALVYVVKAHSTPAPLAMKGLQRLNDIGAPIIGAVLNQIDPKKMKGYDSYYEGYYEGYNYTNE